MWIVAKYKPKEFQILKDSFYKVLGEVPEFYNPKIKYERFVNNKLRTFHKNILEIRNFMLDEDHFPYVVFIQGSNFATETIFVKTPDGRGVKIEHDSGTLNRIDRVTASNYGMKINQNNCRNIFVECGKREQMLQVASLYFQCPPWTTKSMLAIMWDVAVTSLEVLSESIPQPE